MVAPTSPHSPLTPPPIPNPHTCWMSLLAALMLARIAPRTAGYCSTRCEGPISTKLLSHRRAVRRVCSSCIMHAGGDEGISRLWRRTSHGEGTGRYEGGSSASARTSTLVRALSGFCPLHGNMVTYDSPHLSIPFHTCPHIPVNSSSPRGCATVR